jgi:hypothetical protein
VWAISYNDAVSTTKVNDIKLKEKIACGLFGSLLKQEIVAQQPLTATVRYAVNVETYTMSKELVTRSPSDDLVFRQGSIRHYVHNGSKTLLPSPVE